MKPKLIVLVLIPVLALAGYWTWSARAPSSATDRLTLYGNVDIREVDLAFNASEHLAEIRVEEGDRVEMGQILARLHTDKLEAALRAAEAAVRAQEQVLARLRSGSRPEELRRARALADAAIAQAETAQITYERQLKLDRQKLTAPEDVDHARAAANAAKAEARAAEAGFDLLRAGARAEDIAEAEARLEVLRAERVLARQRLDDAELRAPAPGVVRERILEPGDLATPQTPVLTLALIEPLWVRAFVAEPDLGRVAPGLRAEVRTDSFPDKAYAGWVGHISPTAEFTPKTVETTDLRTRLVYQVRVIVCNPQDELRLGMPATVEIPLDQPRPASGTRNGC